MRTTARRVFCRDEVGKGYSFDLNALERGDEPRGWTWSPAPPGDPTPDWVHRTVGGPTISTWAEPLGVALACTFDEARAAYRMLAKARHPDHGGEAEAFRSLTSAWDLAKLHFQPPADGETLTSAQVEAIRRTWESTAAVPTPPPGEPMPRVVRMPSRVFCSRCKTIIEGGEASVHVIAAARFECLACHCNVGAKE